MYKKVDTNLNFVQREKEVEKFWDDNNIFEKSIDSRKKGESYVFYDGPPTANGKPHIGHVLTRAIKDMIPRYRAMKGYQVPRKAGWDTHGLRNMVLSRSSRSVKSLYGNTRVCGRTSPALLASGLTWNTLMLPMTTTL